MWHKQGSEWLREHGTGGGVNLATSDLEYFVSISVTAFILIGQIWIIESWIRHLSTVIIPCHPSHSTCIDCHLSRNQSIRLFPLVGTRTHITHKHTHIPSVHCMNSGVHPRATTTTTTGSRSRWPGLGLPTEQVAGSGLFGACLQVQLHRRMWLVYHVKEYITKQCKLCKRCKYSREAQVGCE